MPMKSTKYSMMTKQPMMTKPMMDRKPGYMGLLRPNAMADERKRMMEEERIAKKVNQIPGKIRRMAMRAPPGVGMM